MLCRDENGYKCHTQSESHLRQVRVFAESPEAFVEFYSKEFLDAFMEELRRKTENVRSKATSIWKSVIAERHHIHLNSTRWLTLTEFVKWIGKEGLAQVDVDEEGKWHVRYINRDPAVEERKKALERKEKMDADDSERASKMVERQIKEAQKALREKGLAPGADKVAVASQELRREEGEKISLGTIGSSGASNKTCVLASGIFRAIPCQSVPIRTNPYQSVPIITLVLVLALILILNLIRILPLRASTAFGASDDSAEEDQEGVSAGGSSRGGGSSRAAKVGAPTDRVRAGPRSILGGGTVAATAQGGDTVGIKRKLTAVEEIMMKEKRKKEMDEAEAKRLKAEEAAADLAVASDGAPWLLKGIVVKVLNKSLADGKFYKKKGVVQLVLFFLYASIHVCACVVVCG